MTQIIDGKAISLQIKDELKVKVAELKEKGVQITLAVIQVGNDPASSVYVNNKKKACEIRDELLKKGITLIDTKDETRYEIN